MPSPKFEGPRGARLFRSSLESPDMRDFIKRLEESMESTIELVLNVVLQDMLTFLKGYTNVIRPPDYRVSYYGGDPKAWRPAHPGGWADISRNLVTHYKGEVYKTAKGNWSMLLWNDAVTEKGENLAMMVEAHAGFFVLTGLFQPGGVVEWTLARAIRRLAPGWQLKGFHEGPLYDEQGNQLDIPSGQAIVTPVAGVAP